MESYLDQVRDLCADNWYTSLPLASASLARHTNLVGTIRNIRKDIPEAIRTKKLRRGGAILRQNDKGILILKQKDKRDICMLSNKHDGPFSMTAKPQIAND